MKKTVSVNIKGTNFLIEEDAYELLQDYLDRLNVVLKNEEGSQDIIEDIELRIAEICSTKLNDSKTVIELQEIEEILEALGDPSEYVENDEFEEESTGEKATYSNVKGDRRLFRDTDGAVLGGICAGIANYFNMDVVIIRILFVIIGLFGGFGIPLYIILWFIIPRAETTIDRLRMKGRPITVETVREEVEEAANRIKTGSKKFANRMRHDDSYSRRMNNVGRIFKALLGGILITCGIIFLVAFILFFVQGFEFLPVKGDGGFMSITEYGELVLANAKDVQWMWIGGLMGSISGILFLLSSGIILIFNLATKWTKWALIGLIGVGMAGGIICASMGIKAGRDTAIPVTSSTKITPLEGIDAEEITILPRLKTSIKPGESIVRSEYELGYFGIENGKLFKHGIDIEYIQTQDTVFHVWVEKLAYGKSHFFAKKRAKNIDHISKIDGDTILIDTKYYFPKEDKLRSQRVKLIVEVPVGKRVRLENDIIELGGHRQYQGDRRLDQQEGYFESDGTYRHYVYD